MSAPSINPAMIAPAASLAPGSAADKPEEVFSFEAVLAAQLGLAPAALKAVLNLQPASAPSTQPQLEKASLEDEKQLVDVAPDLMFLPAGFTPAQPVIVAPLPSLGAGNDPHAASESQPVSLTPSILPVKPADLSRMLTEAAPELGEGVAEVGNKSVGPAVTPAIEVQASPARPATLAANLQTLPVADDLMQSAPDALPDGQAPPLQPAQASVPALGRDTRLDSMQPLQQSNAPISGTVGDSRWAGAFSQRVVWMVGQQVQVAEFRVEPPQLGPIEVRLSITNDQANLMITAPHAVAREAIQASLVRLQEMLLDSGVALGNVFVGAQTPHDQRRFEDDGSSARSDRSIGAVDGLTAVGESQVPVRRALGLVDLFA